MKGNWGIKIVVVFLFAFVLFAGAPVAVAQSSSTHQAKIEGTITLEPGVVSTTSTPAYVLKKDQQSGRWAYVPNKEGASPLGVPDNSASALAEELNNARRRASALAKHIKEAKAAANAVGKALGEQDLRIDEHKGRLNGLDKAVADAKKLAQQGVSAMSRSNWALLLSAFAAVLALVAFVMTMGGRRSQAQEPEGKTSFIPREAPAPPTAGEGKPSPERSAGRRGKGGGDQPVAPPAAPVVDSAAAKGEAPK